MTNEKTAENDTDSTFIADDGHIENSGVGVAVSYEKSMALRLELAMASVQRYSALAAFDPDAGAMLAQWGAYYSEIKNEISAGNFEGAYDIALPVSEQTH